MNDIRNIQLGAKLQVHNQQLKVFSNTKPGHEQISMNGGGNLIKVFDNYITEGSWVSRCCSVNHSDRLRGGTLFEQVGKHTLSKKVLPGNQKQG